MNEYPEGVIVADVLDGCGDNLQVTYSDNWKRIINGDLAGGKNGTCKQSIACRKIKALGGITWVYRGKCSSNGLR